MITIPSIWVRLNSSSVDISSNFLMIEQNNATSIASPDDICENVGHILFSPSIPFSLIKTDIFLPASLLLIPNLAVSRFEILDFNIIVNI